MRGWQHSHSAKVRDVAWKLKHGYSVLNPGKRFRPAGRSLTGKAYFQNGGQQSEVGGQTSDLRPLTSDLQKDSPTNAPQKPEADNGSAVASKLPSAAASSAVGNFERGDMSPRGKAVTCPRTPNILRALVLAATTLTSLASASPADDRWLDAVALVESSYNSSAIGDGGRARGVFQFHRDAWEVARGVDSSVVDYLSGSTNAAQSRLAAAAYLTWLRQRFAANGIAMPTDSQLYAAYNCGFAGFKLKYKFDVTRTPRTTQRACARIESAIQKHSTFNIQHSTSTGR